MSIQFTDKEFTNLNVWITKVSESYHNLSPESKLAFNKIFDLLYDKYKENEQTKLKKVFKATLKDLGDCV
jgi:hypothetical protein